MKEEEVVLKKLAVLATLHMSQHNFTKYPINTDSLICAIVQFRPDAICVEWRSAEETGEDYVGKCYQAYLKNGENELAGNEIERLAFPAAKKIGLDELFDKCQDIVDKRYFQS